MKTIRVAAAVIREGDRVFAAQRGYGRAKDGWEFPGGKIEPGETPEQALVREIREELGAEITVGEKLTQVEWDYPDFHLSMGCYWCAAAPGSLTLREHEAARWLGPDELDAVDWLPADREAVAALKEHFKSETDTRQGASSAPCPLNQGPSAPGLRLSEITLLGRENNIRLLPRE